MYAARSRQRKKPTRSWPWAKSRQLEGKEKGLELLRSVKRPQQGQGGGIGPSKRGVQEINKGNKATFSRNVQSPRVSYQGKRSKAPT